MHHFLWEALKKKKSKSHAEIKLSTNPITDVQLIHSSTDHHETLSVTIRASHKLNTTALNAVIAEMLAQELLKHNCISISETTNSEDSDIIYVGTVEAVNLSDPPTTFVNQEDVHE